MTASTYQVSSRIALFGIALIWMIAETSPTLAHDSWINRGGYRNPAGEWCCGDYDCQSTDQIAVTGKGWVIGAALTRPRSIAILVERAFALRLLSLSQP